MISLKMHEHLFMIFSEIHRIEEAPASFIMLLHLREVDFQEILKINEKSGLSEEGTDARDPVLGPFRRHFLKYFYINI